MLAVESVFFTSRGDVFLRENKTKNY